MLCVEHYQYLCKNNLRDTRIHEVFFFCCADAVRGVLSSLTICCLLLFVFLLGAKAGDGDADQEIQGAAAGSERREAFQGLPASGDDGPQEGQLWENKISILRHTLFIASVVDVPPLNHQRVKKLLFWTRLKFLL